MNLWSRFKKISIWTRISIILAIIPILWFTWNYINYNFIDPYDLVLYITETDLEMNHDSTFTAKLVFLTQGCNNSYRTVYFIEGPNTIKSKYGENVNMRFISLSKCPSCKYMMILRNLGKPIDDEVKLPLIFSTNDFSFEKLDPRVSSQEFKEFVGEGKLNININPPIKFEEYIGVGYVSLPTHEKIEEVSCHLKNNRKWCQIINFTVKFSRMPTDLGGVQIVGKRIEFPPISKTEFETFHLDISKNKFVPYNSEIQLFKEHKGMKGIC